MHILIPPKIETGEPEIYMIANKHQYKDSFILNNTLIDLKWSQITDIIKETDTHFLGQLYNSTWIHYIPLPFLEYINSIVTLQKDGIGAEWCNTEEKIFNISSGNLFNVDECTLYTKGNACGAISALIIESTYFTMAVSK